MAILKRIEPTVQEITLEEYENRMGIKPAGPASKESSDVGQPMAASTTVEAGAPFSGTRSDAIKILQERGLAYNDLKRKTKKELVEML